MGCDIHGMFERKERDFWVNTGDPKIGRNYIMFSVLGNVRNSDGIPFIAERRFHSEMEEIRKKYYDNSTDIEEIISELDASDAFRALLSRWWGDAHSASYVTLKEMKEYNINQKYYDKSLILSKDKNGKITSTCAWTSGNHMGEVGETTVFEIWGAESWNRLIAFGENLRVTHNLTDEDIRLSFFFDN